MPHVPLQERNSRYITGDVGGAPPWAAIHYSKADTLQEAAIPLHSRSLSRGLGLACPPSCSAHRDNEFTAAARPGDGKQRSTGCLCLQEMLPAVPPFSLDAKISSYQAYFQCPPFAQPQKRKVHPTQCNKPHRCTAAPQIHPWVVQTCQTPGSGSPPHLLCRSPVAAPVLLPCLPGRLRNGDAN